MFGVDGVLVHLFGYFIWMQQHSAWIENAFHMFGVDGIWVHLFGYFIWMQHNSAWIEMNLYVWCGRHFGSFIWILHLNATKFSIDRKYIHMFDGNTIQHWWKIHSYVWCGRCFSSFIWKFHLNATKIQHRNEFICLVWTAFWFIYLDISFEYNKIQHG